MHRALLGLAAVATGTSLAACGAPPARSVAATSPTAAASTLSTAAATALPTPSPTPTPPQLPLLIVQQPSVLEAIDASGTPQWSFNPDTAVGAGSGSVIGTVTAGAHLLLASDRKVTVIDRGGRVIGTGATVNSAAQPGGVDISPDPTGTRWAWSTLDDAPIASPGSTPSANRWSGAVWVAGLGEAPHRVLSWSEPGDTRVAVFLWSDRGIVTAVVSDGCGPVPQETSTALLDPATGRSTPLEGGDRHVVDVHAGLVLAMRQPETLLVSGAHPATLTERPVTENEHLDGAAISPDGAHVFGSMTSMSGCGGVPEVRTVVLAPATQQSTVLRDVFAEDWLDNAHLIVRGPSDNALRVVDLDGNGDPAPLTHGDLIGVLR